MISVKQADQIISKSIKKFSTVVVSLEKAYGRVLAEVIRADRDQPPFNKALMDGIALKADSYQGGTREFKIQGVQAAGQAQSKLLNDNHCIEIMTGAVLPKGCDCVIPIESVQIKNRVALVDQGLNVKKLMHIRKQGSDCKKGTLLLKKGCVLKSPQIAVVASVGKAKLKVAAKPKIAIISTGDELVDVGKPIKIHQIRKSNSYALHASLLNTQLFEAQIFHVKDDAKKMTTVIRRLINEYDALVLSGGVSMGKFDYVPQVLKALGVNVLFHKVKQKPGRPFWFGQTRSKKPVFALPGNPQSTQVGGVRYVREHLTKALGIQELGDEFVCVAKDYDAKTKFTFFLPVKLKSNKKGLLVAEPIASGGSGDFAAYGKSDGFVELPEGQTKIKAGFVGRFYRWS